MTNRLTKIYTRTGDSGTTSLANGKQILKTAPRIEAIGAIDELNSCIGLLISYLATNDSMTSCLQRVQHQLFDLGGELAVAEKSYTVIEPSEIKYLEAQIDNINTKLPPLKEFILPGGSIGASYTHLARSICRRAERRLIALTQYEGEEVNNHCVIYLNRLSDLLFVASREIARRQGGEETLWQPREKR